MVKPYTESELNKKQQVAKMFNNIAPAYDFLNHFLSMGIDISWRKKAIEQLKDMKQLNLLDIATGTADLAIEASRLKPHKIIGVDISEQMLEIGRKKIEKKSLGNTIHLQNGDSENLPFPENSFNAISCAFGVRNFENLDKGLEEMYRVLSNKGKLVILEFSKPKKFPVKQLYEFYFFRILPLIGKLFSKDQSAYHYLPESVNAFPDGEEFLIRLRSAGFRSPSFISLSFGIATIYTALK
jgi:demethylmenaquinone methyltransferase/2-methoxy-6-polyprenyl-1,4-benzoquinol methylase